MASGEPAGRPYSFADGPPPASLVAMRDLPAAIASYLPELTAFRRDLHAHPEIGFKEVRTSALVAGSLRAGGIDVVEKVGVTGIVATIRGNRPGRHG